MADTEIPELSPRAKPAPLSAPSPAPHSAPPSTPLPILIAGAGLTGLLLAQHLRAVSIPFVLFERDVSASADRGAGWGLTLHWSLPALRELLPPALAARLPEAYVDRALTSTTSSRFPFYDLATGARKARGPVVKPESVVRVSRRRLRRLLTADLEVNWGRAVVGFSEQGDRVVAELESGEAVAGRLLVACDGSHSRIRRKLVPHAESRGIPVGAMGLRMELDAEQVRALRELDPFFLHATSSANNSFAYFSLLDAPGDPGNEIGRYTVQLVVSWPLVEGFLGRHAITAVPDTNRERLHLVREISKTWIDPFRQLALGLPEDTEVVPIVLDDWPPPRDLRTDGRVVLMGDAMHPMAMYRGEGANHAIVDVHDFAKHVIPLFQQDPPKGEDLRDAIHRYEALVVKRVRPAVLASRRACLDAHDWTRVNSSESPSPLLTPRVMMLDYGGESE